MQKNFLVSVIIPVHNSFKFIGRCLRSLKNQTLNKKYYEIIIIDDFSTDLSLNEIEKHKSNNIKLIKNNSNLGLPASLNKGIKEAKGTLIIRVDSDDWVHEDFLDILSTFLCINKNLDAVSCDYALTDVNEKELKIENCLKKPIGCGIMFRTQQLFELGLYDLKFKYAEEEALRKFFLKKYSITRIPLNLYRYRQHKNNRSKNKKLVKFYNKKIK
jgi:glycosyltransferase involved in cell wall biosynthesis